MKINVVTNLKKRIQKIAHIDFRQASLKKLYEILRENGYPHGFLKKLIFCTSNTCISENQEPPSNDPPAEPINDPIDNRIKFASLPALPGLTNKLINIFSVINNLKIAKYNVTTNRSLFTNLKDKLPLLSKSDCIYSVSCIDCPDIYIGQTSQALKKRLTLHKSDIRLHPDRCALALHASNNGHQFDLNNVKILAVESNYDKRLFLEMCFINDHSNSVNKKTDIKSLSSIYSYLLSINKSASVSNISLSS